MSFYIHGSTSEQIKAHNGANNISDEAHQQILKNLGLNQPNQLNLASNYQ